jgi:hypothetical protein
MVTLISQLQSTAGKKKHEVTTDKQTKVSIKKNIFIGVLNEMLKVAQQVKKFSACKKLKLPLPNS